MKYVRLFYEDVVGLQSLHDLLWRRSTPQERAEVNEGGLVL